MHALRPALLAAVCAAVVTGGRAESPPEPPVSYLPTPYSAEQIRDAWQPGLVVETRTTSTGAETTERLVVVAASAERVTIRREPLAAGAAAEPAARELTATWAELRDHARFAAKDATRERAECRSALGVQPGWRYATRNEHGDALTMCFADATPGPPVEYETRREGKLLSRTEHVRYERPRGAQGERR
jgi:hypothetical protein